MHAYVRVHMYACIRTCTYVRMHTYMYTCMHAYVHVHMYVCMHTHMGVSIQSIVLYLAVINTIVKKNITIRPLVFVYVKYTLTFQLLCCNFHHNMQTNTETVTFLTALVHCFPIATVLMTSKIVAFAMLISLEEPHSTHHTLLNRDQGQPSWIVGGHD